MSVTIKTVDAHTPAARHGIKPGDILVSINGEFIKDVLDYMYYASETVLKLVTKRDGKYRMYRIEKGEYEDLGLEFETYLMDKKQSCCNKCVFCFIDQLPPGMRKTLYFKDDDARLSFLQGNYITLTNLKQEDVDRIITMKLNVNVSVHTTNPELRKIMMKNRFAGDKLVYLKQMAEGGIMLNCQIVLCPDLNDGDELRRTLTDLGDLMPNVSSIAVVPLGVTKFRCGLFPLRPFTKEDAVKNVAIIEEYQSMFLEKYGTRLVFPSDEFYLKAELPMPDADFYEGYPQYENGVGMIRSLYDEFTEAVLDYPTNVLMKKRRISIATGAAAFDLISSLAKIAEERFDGLTVRVYKIINNFFGDTITVAGLLTATDITAQLAGEDLGDELLLTSSMIMRNSDVFLDDVHIYEVEDKLDVKIRLTDNDGDSLAAAMLGEMKGR
ncbi:MAG: DUF512 domain-containing protein [Oscillospiraceae bacterium]|nr:DUF512 domain-containing protein [Oscillospiraceae bacterium]